VDIAAGKFTWFHPYFTSFFHLALDFTKINFITQILPLAYHTLQSATE
jgi:hypothetical protein